MSSTTMDNNNDATRKQSGSLPSIGYMDRDRISTDKIAYHKHNPSSAVPRTISASSGTANMANGDEQDDKLNTIQNRMSLPSLQEAIYESKKDGTYAQPLHPLSASSATNYPSSMSIPSTPTQHPASHIPAQLPRNLAPPSLGMQPRSNLTQSTGNTHSDSRYPTYASQSIPSGSYQQLNRVMGQQSQAGVQQQPHHLPDSYTRGDGSDGRIETQNYIVSEKSGRRSPMQGHSNSQYPPPPVPSLPSSQLPQLASSAENRHYNQVSSHHVEQHNYPSNVSQKSYHAALPSESSNAALAQHSYPPARYEPNAPRTGSYESEGFVQAIDGPYSPKIKSMSKHDYKDPYGLAINRALDISDLRRELDTVRENSSYLYHFVMQFTPQSQQQGGFSGPKYTGQTDPSLQSLDDSLAMARRSVQALEFWRNKVVADQNRKQEQQLNISKAAKRSIDYIEDEMGYSDDKGTALPSDPKKQRRGKAAPPGRCHSCNRAETPEWRRGPDGARTLCNACGLHYAKLTRKLTKNSALTMSNSSIPRKPASTTSIG